MQHVIAWVSVIAPALAGMGAAQAADPVALIERCEKAKADRWDGVTHYVVVQSMMGQTVALPHERFEAPGPDGSMRPAFRPMTSDSPLSSGQLKEFAVKAEMVGSGLSNEMTLAGFPPGMIGGPSDPWASADPSVMMGGAAAFLRAGADAQQANKRERDAAVGEASAAAAATAEMARRMRYVGTEPVEGVVTQHLRAEGVGQRHAAADGGQLLIDTVDLWIDDRNCVPLKLALAGTVTAQGQTRPMTLERINSLYRVVAGSKMYEPYRQVMRVKGALTPDQERELAESQARLADLERQLAQMPPGQRDMIMQRMSPQMEMMKRMAAGGGIEVVTEVQQILVNPDDEALRRVQLSAAATSLGGSMAAPPAMAGMAPQAQSLAAAAPPAGAGAPVAAAPAQDAYRACLERKARERQAAQQKKQGVGRLLGAAGRIAGRLGGADLTQLFGDVQMTAATADDLSAAARDLGLTEDEIASCRSAG